ncbi:hypothetical protein LTR56_006338 [Elasticomyces elasticus]|nr:hypothetical protein LTR56_006338 [Elasticomyces elasticus]KAK3663386.1 hypothetical protein LTR22_005793 [Elasticomyces elasticus]KAK4925465.1 hypothetical protein LTR49_007529 [Elasticomyces elasticus]KAK5764560.1 hypothetical protein LTS12_005290 [Elasticomyces elasticus]
MAAYSTGASWGFQDLPGNDTPGGWTQDDVDEQIHGETKTEPKQEPDIKTEEPSSPPPQQPHQRTHWPSRTCRICLEVVEPTLHTDDATPNIVPEALRPAPRVTYESPPGDGGRLLRPCHCKGSQKYVHTDCLTAWRLQDPLQKRNYWECPTCRYKYRLSRLTWGRWVGSTLSQIALTVLIFVTGMFVLGFVADPIINLYLDPVSTIYTRGGPGGSLLFEDEPASWGEHFLKGFASIGLLGFAKFLLTLSPWHWFNMRGTGIAVHRSGGVGGNGRDRLAGLNWLAVIVGVATVMWAVWKMVRSFSRRVLEKAGENVMDVPATEGEEDEDD